MLNKLASELLSDMAPPYFATLLIIVIFLMVGETLEMKIPPPLSMG